MRFRGPLVLGLTLLMARPALAQKAEAAAAFERGRDLIAKGRTAEACSEFETSMRLEPANGTLYNLALCHEALGKIASAWSELKELAANDTNAARAKDAAKRAAALEKKLTRMRIVVSAPTDELVIQRDGIDVTGLAGKDVPVDPGRYTFVASAPGHADARVEVDLTAPGQTIDVTIPPLVASAGGGGDDGPALALDPYADRLTLRPLALPRGVLEADGHVEWQSSQGFDQDPFTTFVGARRGFGRVEAHAMLGVHTRYAQDDYRPTIVQSIALGADYLIQPLFTAGVSYRKYHPLGGDVQRGFDFRADIGRKKIISPAVALVGYTGIGFESRQDRGQSSAPNSFQLVGDGAVQLAPLRRVTVEGLVRLRVDLGGDLYGDPLLLDVGAAATVFLTRQIDAYLDTALAVLPRNADLRVVTVGVKYRHP